MVTLEDVGREAGVSRMTVSNYLSGKANLRKGTADRVARAIEKLGYRPNLSARHLSSGKSKTIGFAVVELDKSPFSCELAAQLSDQAEVRGYQLLVQQTRRMPHVERSMMELVCSQLCDGCILSASSIDPDEIRRWAKDVPIVGFDTPELEGVVDTVSTPVRRAMSMGVHYLAEVGCRRIMVLGVDYRPLAELRAKNGLSISEARLLGCLEACCDLGLPCGSGQVVSCGWSVYAGYDAMVQAINRDGVWFDGVMCLTDSIAIGAMGALRDCGVSIPGEVSVMGFDGIEVAQFMRPALSTVAVDISAVAQACLDCVLDSVEGGGIEREPRSVEVDCRLEVRGSTADPKQG